MNGFLNFSSRNYLRFYQKKKKVFEKRKVNWIVEKFIFVFLLKKKKTGGYTLSGRTAKSHILLSGVMMLDIKPSSDYLSRSTGSFSNFSMLFAGKKKIRKIDYVINIFKTQGIFRIFKKIRNFKVEWNMDDAPLFTWNIL